MYRKQYTTAATTETSMGTGSSKKTGNSLAANSIQNKSTGPVSVTKADTDKNPKKDNNKEMEKVMKKLGAMSRGRKVPYWERVDMDQLLKTLKVKGNEAKNWFDIIDYLVDSAIPKIEPNTKRKGWQTVRLFISSTFKDMHSEREHLVKHIIPTLRQWCEKRKIHLIECDLRWGVPKDANTRETLMTCLSEIDRCRQENEYPYFLSLLSERYGYVMDPKDVPADLKARYKWLPGMSVTALEIMTGAFWDNNPNALYMFRKPGYLQRVDEDLKSVYCESDPLAIESLEILKKKVKSRFPQQLMDYDCIVEGRDESGKRHVFGGLDKFGESILEHFKVRIAHQYPEISTHHQLTETEVKRAEQEEFMMQRSQVLLGRDKEVSEIDCYINSQEEKARLLTLVGYPGAGKSALIAYSAKEHYQKLHLKVFFHFVGVTPDSTSLFSVLSRIYRECMPSDQQDSMPMDENDMIRYAPTMFQEVAEEAKRNGYKQLVLFIDALNQLDDTGSAQKLTWLPRKLPNGMRVVVSTLEGVCLDSLRTHSDPSAEVAVNPLDESVRRCIAEELLLMYNKRLDSEQMTILINKADAGRPLYLSISCEELRVFGDFRELTNKVKALAEELSGLLEMVLSRVEQEFGGELVKAALCLIEASHFGLEEAELLHLLSVKPVLPASVKDCSVEDFKNKLPMALWGFVYVGLRSFLRPSGSGGEGRVDFYHRTISKVVRKMYLTDQHEAEKWHGRLVQFFKGCKNISRKAEELPYHYKELGDLEGLKECLLSREMFEYMYTESNKRLLMHYWEVAGGYELAAKSYKSTLDIYMKKYNIDGTEEGEKLATKVAWFLVDIGEYDTANQLLESIIEKLKAKYGPEALELADPLHATMQLLMNKALKYVYGSHPGYLDCCNKGYSLSLLTVKVHRRKFSPDSNHLAEVLSLCGYFDDTLLEESRAIFEKNNNKVGLAVVLYTLAEKKQHSDSLDVLIKLFNEALALCKTYFGSCHLKTGRCLQLFGQMYWNKWTHSTEHREWLEECLPLYSMELEILKEILGHNHPTTVRSREDVIIILQNLGRNEEADKLLLQQPETREDI